MTNRNLAEEARVGRFCEDLFYRLSVFPIAVPAVLDREDDIALPDSVPETRHCRVQRVGVRANGELRIIRPLKEVACMRAGYPFHSLFVRIARLRSA